MRSFVFYDKAAWGDGPWADEADYTAWVDDATAYACVTRRNLYGAWCGFVGVDAEHALYQAPLSDESFNFVDVHGGVDFAGLCDEDDDMFGPPVRRWWVGFSCMQPTDLVPTLESELAKHTTQKFVHNLTYRPFPYVRENTELLATQLAFHDDRIR